MKKATQTISLPPVETEKIVAGEPFIPAGTSSSGLPLRYEVESGAAIISEEGHLIVQGPGPVTLIAYQDGNETYEGAEAARTTFCVSPAKPAISVENNEAASFHATLVSDRKEGNQWYLNGEIIKGAVNQSYMAKAEGSYSVEVNIGGCVGPVSEAVVITGLGEKLKASALKVFPNPTARLVRVEFASKKGTEAIKVKLVNASGTELYLPVQLKDLQGHKSAEMDISSLAAGIYYVLIGDGEILTRAKVFKK